MDKSWRVPSPRIVLDQGGGWGLRLLLVVLVLGAIAGAFFAGVFLAREEGKPQIALSATLRQENQALVEEMAVLRGDKTAIELSQRIDQDTLLAAQQSLKAEQEVRQTLEKDLSALKRLIREGGDGILKIQDFVLMTVGEGLYEYSFTTSQVISDYPESVATASIKLVGKRGGKEIELGLNKLPGSEPLSQALKFKHFQNVRGTIRVPANLEPEAVTIEIKPTSKQLIPITESFPWPKSPEAGG
ncbi:MAG: hypothetical protein IPN92_07245 [Chromatiaceae bacterium]|nr:hypothetical protein [Chromatiaceae bacterium]